jgi:hypothetical protein
LPWHWIRPACARCGSWCWCTGYFIIPVFQPLHVKTLVFEIPAHRCDLCVDSDESSFGCLWTPKRQYNLYDSLVRHDWFGKRYYCATSRRWPGENTSERDKDPGLKSNYLEYQSVK